jgi:FAD/FMN-containing dehydrogenase
VRDGTLAQRLLPGAALWELREGISESLSAPPACRTRTTSPCPSPGSRPSAPPRALFAARYPGWEVCLFGHIGDGNLHVNVMKPDAIDKEAFLAQTARGRPRHVRARARHGGSISAEHGIGLLKKPYLGYTRSPPRSRSCAPIKRALDPNNILNPGKIL